MSGHADTIRSALLTATFEHSATRSDVDDALDALVAENQQLRDALGDAHEELLAYGDFTAANRISAALAGTPSEDPPIEDLPDPSHDDVRGRAPSFNLFRNPSEDT